MGKSSRGVVMGRQSKKIFLMQMTSNLDSPEKTLQKTRYDTGSISSIRIKFKMVLKALLSPSMGTRR